MTTSKEGFDRARIILDNTGDNRISAAGTIGDSSYNFSAEGSMRVKIENAGGSNEVTILGAIGNSAFETIATLTGNQSSVIDVSTYEFIRFSCTVYDSSPFDFFVGGFPYKSATSITGQVDGLFSIEGAEDGSMDEISKDDTSWEQYTYQNANPKSVTFQNTTGDGSTVLLINYDDPGAASNVGRQVFDGGFITITLNPDAATPIPVWYKALSGTVTFVADEII